LVLTSPTVSGGVKRGRKKKGTSAVRGAQLCGGRQAPRKGLLKKRPVNPKGEQGRAANAQPLFLTRGWLERGGGMKKLKKNWPVQGH